MQEAKARRDINKYVPQFAAGILCLIIFSLLCGYFLLSDIHSLAVRMTDDSYYYFQPAWMFSKTGQFTTNGETLTYGFQPLWTLCLAVVALFMPNKEIFLRAGLLLAAFFYCGTGFLLYRLCREWMGRWQALIAPAIWLINPPLIDVFTDGKENALHAFLLVALLSLAYSFVKGKRSPAHFILFGALSGLLFLSRFNSGIAIAVLTIMFLRFMPAKAGERIRGILYAALPAVFITVPWLIYSSVALGSVFPNSGTVKLLFVKPNLALYLSQKIPFLRVDWFVPFLSLKERLWLRVPDQVFPSVSGTFSYLARFIRGKSLGFWNPYLIPVLILFIICLCVWLVRPKSVRTVAIVSASLRYHLPIWAIFFYAILNTGVNALLLFRYLYWGIWYAVPEMLSCVLLAAGVAAFTINSLDRMIGLRPLWHGLGKPMKVCSVAIIAALLLVVPVMRVAAHLRPASYKGTPGWQEAAWGAHFWMNQHIPRGAKVGGWGSGLIGYFAEGPIVVNLDGLANSPKFVSSVYRDSVLYDNGLTDRNATWEYIQEIGISYAADWVYVNDLGSQPFMGAIPQENYKVVYMTSAISGSESQPRCYVIVKLSY